MKNENRFIEYLDFWQNGVTNHDLYDHTKPAEYTDLVERCRDGETLTIEPLQADRITLPNVKYYKASWESFADPKHVLSEEEVALYKEWFGAPPPKYY